ncbi:MAG TPA: pseudouridine synthase [Amnibacterium sp.]|nr:pseudouridine synthase [Amnibacterium sp.]
MQKVLARAGLGSRRACENLIAEGRVLVNGLPASLGVRVDPLRDVVRVDGAPIPTASGLVHLAVHKPLGMLSAMTSEDGRPCVGDLVVEQGTGLHHVGRLDADSEGLLLVMNDGGLSHRLTHPSYRVPKRYLVELDGQLHRTASRALRTGVDLDDGPARVDDLQVVDATPGRTLVEVEIHEGRNRIIRRMFEALDLDVLRLVRLSIGPIRLGELKPGRLRHLNAAEVRALYALVDRSPER